jgi:hypothetical protein
MQVLIRWLWLGLIASHSLLAQNTDLFDQHDLLEVELRVDLLALQADRGKTVDYHPAGLRYVAEEDTLSVLTEVRTRGHFRRQPQVCEFPPLKLKIGKKTRQGTLFAAHDELKLVAHCKEDELVLREYLLYRIYDLLSDHSLRVRPIRITYRDLRGAVPPETHLAFFLEHQDVADDRMQATQMEDMRLQPSMIDPDNLVLVSLFSYMIGNSDWDVLLEKNVRIFQIPEEDRPILLPYDFDWSGAVGARYTGLGKDYPYRRLKGPYADQRTYERWLGHILVREEMILDLYRQCDLFGSNRERREAMAFVQESLEQMRSPEFHQEIAALTQGR